MKTTTRYKTLAVSLSAIVGGALMASAAAVQTTAATYPLNVSFTSAPPAAIVTVDGIPTLSTTDVNPGDFEFVFTDGSGKVDGVTDILVTNLPSGDAPYTRGSFITDVSGSLRSSGRPAVPSVMMSVHGNGYLQDDTGTAITSATLSFTFNGKLASESSGVATPLNTNVTVIRSNSVTGVVTTNTVATGGNFTNTTVIVTNGPAFTTLAFIINESLIGPTNTANGTNAITQNNSAFIDINDRAPISDDSGLGYNFGTPSATNILGTQTFLVSITNTSGTNVTISTTNVTFNWFAIGTNTTVENAFSNSFAEVGLNSTDMDAFISAYINSASSNSASSITLVRQILTNANAAFSGSFSNTTITPPNIFSNGWFDVVGTVKGSINGHGVHHSLNNETATLLSGSHTVFTAGSDTNGAPVVFETTFPNVNNGSVDVFTRMDGTVVTVNNKIWMSSEMFGGGNSADFSGTGTINTHKQSYTENLRGAGFSRGSMASLTGQTGLLIISFGTNVTTLDNIAANPTVTILATNPSPSVFSFGPLFIFEGNNDVTNLVNGTNQIQAHNSWDLPVAASTNSVLNGIKTMNAKGRIQGQTFGPIGGINFDPFFD